jgi:ribonuclease-3
VIHRLFADLLTAAPQLGAGLDWKTSLQELSAERGLGVPEYRVSEEGPDHAKLFAAQVILGGLPRGAGSGRTKKEAEQNAASAAYTSLHAASADGNGSSAQNGSAGDGATTAQTNTPVAPTPTGAPMTDSAAVEPVEPGAVEPASVDPVAVESGPVDGPDPARSGA